ncbi:hypothetical protein SH1V18_45330 [Vallitalea longa]|uniref:Serine aminopeptidase S33 domain-containing protein n=1 Tax=Vallitalea longa TaxID=2936439 RepID=A0A9W5YIQ8_9FIRM|nr:prolyl oligopeptidase family serine peptidase [Vallitalea longa]GKX32053.1 hypothetical protein SH1V18_45330 [Vallitalea longa]
MKKLILITLIILLTFSGCNNYSKSDEPITDSNQSESTENGTSPEQEKSNDTDNKYEKTAIDLFNLYINKDFKSIIDDTNFSKELQNQLSEDNLAKADTQITGLVGDFEKILSTNSITQDKNTTVTIISKCSKSNLMCIVMFDENESILGFNLLPTSEGADLDVSLPENAEEIPVEFGADEYKLSGLLTVPKGKDEYPIVILVQGSGPSDKDETIGPNKPFRDIAYSLVSNGIGVLRYDKRTYTHRNKIIANQDQLTVYDETIDDVVYAYDYLVDNKDITAKGIYIIGHSLGGYLMPRIANELPDANGYIFLAGSARPLEDLLVYQIPYLANLDNIVTDEEQQQIDYYKNVYDRVKSLDESSTYTAKDLGGTGKKYWLDLKDYRPTVMAQEITKPMLFLQGKRDYQVTLDDFNLWKESLESKDTVTFKLYDGLNHLFMKGEGTPSPTEYSIASNVDKQVTDDIAEFILSNQ